MVSFSWSRSVIARILAVAAAPLLGIVGYSVMTAWEGVQEARRLQSIAEFNALAPAASLVIHEMQRERGQSAGHIASKGKNFADTLPGRRDATDAAILDFQTSFQSWLATHAGSPIAKQAEKADGLLAQIPALRQRISAQATTVPELAKQYTGTIRSLFGLLYGVGAQINDLESAQRYEAYLSLLEGKERAGLERAMGAAGFGAKKFAPPILARFIKLIGAQEMFFAQFKKKAFPSDVEVFLDTVTGEPVADVQRMRDIAIASAETGDTKGITAPYWFARITAKIDQMKQVEDKTAAHLIASSAARAEAAWNDFLLRIVGTLAGIIAVLGIALVAARSVSGPLGRLSVATEKLADGNAGVEVPETGRKDEIGVLAGAIAASQSASREIAALQAEQVEQRAASEATRKAELKEMADSFEAAVRMIVQEVGTGARALTASATELEATADQASLLSAKVASASQQASGNVEAAAGATDSLRGSIDGISRDTSTTTERSKAAVTEAEGARARVDSLNDASKRIGDVIELINAIAGQTNLLALNATIEAARAGEAGKGFAVVASEVKNLANQTAKATEDIGAQVGRMQTEVSAAVDAIEAISSAIAEIDEVATGVSAAVTEQSVSTSEIATSVSEAATGAREVNETIDAVRVGAEATGERAGQVLQAANTLTEQSVELSAAVDDFLARVRAA